MSFLTGLRPTLRTTSSLHLTTKTSIPTLTTLRTFTSSPHHSLARLSLIGRLADTPELVPTSTGNDMIKYALATSHGPRDNRQTSWWRVACFPGDRQGVRELMGGLGKGALVHVDGECSMNKYTDSEGKDRSALNIVQKGIEVLDARRATDESTQSE